MITLGEIARGVGGAVRLMKGDLSGLALLDRSREGFWRSFRPAVLLAPLYAFYLMMIYDGATTASSDLRVAVAEGLRYVIEWTLFPVVLLELSRLMGRAPRYIGSVVALNWANIPLLIGVVALAAATRLVAPDLVGAVELVILVATLVLVTRILRFTLDVPWMPAVALAALNLWLSLMLGLIVNGIIGFRFTDGSV
ncbi:hypothetical protein [Reyranella sp. CPCC 100927]|uniref:hypothetical protein n=1 Tax=Reyranella sp. CPCC 100927 TaxID=2599616 RepID=UPI0011B7F3C4|nr:hypothetical protein [Reyranella sp. CPCC 100927]TWT15691.1 hypothetical protein FQU96_04920 [Reyranella sp. CPCC 100927]